MQELAALVGRRKGGSDVARPASSSAQESCWKLARCPPIDVNDQSAREARAFAFLRSTPEEDRRACGCSQVGSVATPPRPNRMGPPLRSASQQRLEVAAVRPKSVTPTAALPQQEDLPPTPKRSIDRSPTISMRRRTKATMIPRLLTLLRFRRRQQCHQRRLKRLLLSPPSLPQKRMSRRCSRLNQHSLKPQTQAFQAVRRQRQL